ncbi:hypothetical protein [Flavobacterium sp.]|uniref:hypothetical protein n=1 Tax=Flavobacterium sp. TaxID=239 RepID=UPI003D6B6D04
MKKREVIGLFLIIATVCFLSSCDRSIQRFQQQNQISEAERACVDKVIAIDDSIGKIRNKECQKLSLSQTISNYTDKMKKISTEGCPKEFSKSFNQHIDSWKNLLEVTDKYPEMRGEMHDLFKELEKSKDSAVFKKLKNVVWETWDLVEITSK